SALVTAQNKIYDSTAAATVTCALSPAVTGLTCAATSATFDNANVGTGKTVSASGISLSGDGASNYTVNATASTTANITAAAATTSVTAQNKSDDSTAAATI